jgi:aspartate 1-decarboxylase
MQRVMLKSKIHRATVTDCDLHYVGSITIDADLLQAADILEHEQVHVVDIDNGARFETYTIAGERGSGAMKVNGAAARLVHRGDTIIVISYGQYDQAEMEQYEPRVVHVEANTNRIITVDDAVATLTEAGRHSPPTDSGDTRFARIPESTSIPVSASHEHASAGAYEVRA